MVKKVSQKGFKVKKSSRKDQILVILRDAREEIKLVAEGQSVMQKRMDIGFEEVNGRMDSMENRMGSVEGRMSSVEDKIDLLKRDVASVKEDLNSVKEEMRMGFKTLIAESVEDEEKFAAKTDKKDMILLEKRVANLETAK